MRITSLLPQVEICPPKLAVLSDSLDKRDMFLVSFTGSAMSYPMVGTATSLTSMLFSWVLVVKRSFWSLSDDENETNVNQYSFLVLKYKKWYPFS